MPIRSVTLRILGDSRSARAHVDWANAEGDKIDKKKVTLHITADTPEKKLALLQAWVDKLDKSRTNIEIDVDDKPSQLIFSKITAQLVKLDKTVAKPKISDQGFANAQVQLAALEVEFEKLGRSMHDFSTRTSAEWAVVDKAFHKPLGSLDAFGNEVQKQDKKLRTMFSAGGGFGMLGRFAFGKVALFGGAAAIGGLHLLVDAIMEVAIIWGTAALAAGAWGIAASDAIRDVIHHMQNLHTVSDATDKTIAPMTGHLEKLHDAVRPAVYQIFGDALTVMNSKTGEFTKLVMGANTVMTHFAARTTAAITSGKGFNEFVKNAVPNLNELMGSFAALFGIIGNILHVMPGYAEILLHFGLTFLQVAEWVSRVAQPLIGLGLQVHGFIVWAGLGASAAYFMGRALVFLGNRAIGGVIKSFALLIGEMITLVLEGKFVEAGIFAMNAALDSMAANPFVWVGAAAGAIAGLVYWMIKSKSATTQWGDALQKNIDNAATISQGFKLAQSALVLSTVRLRVEQGKLAHTTQQSGTNMAQSVHTGISPVSHAYMAQSKVVSDAAAVQQRFSAQVQFNTHRMEGLSRVYGGNSKAMGLLNAAGVTQAEWQDHSASGWAIITQKMNGTLAGYKAMSASTGMLNNDLAVLDRNITDQYQATQKLNQGWDQFIADVTGNQTNFDTFALGFQTLHKNMNKALAATNTTTHSFAGLKEKADLTGAAMDGLNQASLTVNQAFSTTVTNANALFDSFRTAGISGKLLDRAIKDAIGPMLQYAKGSKEATGQLIALAEQGTFHGVPTFKNLTKWVGNTHGATKDLKKITDQMTQSEALLTGEMQAQGNFIKQQLLNDINQATLKYFGVRDAAKAYGTAVAASGKQSEDAKNKMDILAGKVFAAGRAMGDSKLKAEKMTAAMLGIPLQRVINIVEHGKGSFSIKQAGIFGRNPGGGPDFIHPNKGVLVPGVGNTDSQPALLTPGELVVPKPLVQGGAVDHLKGMIPGFAAGGLITTGDNTLTGKSSTAFDKQFGRTFTRTMEKRMWAAMSKAMKAASGSGQAIANYAHHFATGLSHPYVWGGTRPSGWDCSGFTGFVYDHFGYHPPRTSQQQQLWSKPSVEQPGALVFFYGTGGNAAHVGISLGGGKMANASQPSVGTIVSGVGGNTGFGIPPGGFHGRGGSLGGLSGKGTNRELGRALAAQMGWGGAQFTALNKLWTRESRWSDTITNPSSGAAGIAQRIQGWGPGYQRGNAQQQIIWGLNYIRNRQDERTPIGAWNHEQRFGWYEKGTPGARPGWAWVGERGPELVNFRGGETVLDHPTSKIVGGYAGGTSFSHAQLEKLFRYWMEHFKKWRHAHPGPYTHLQGQALFKYWDHHWGTWIKHNMHRVTGPDAAHHPFSHGGGAHQEHARGRSLMKTFLNDHTEKSLIKDMHHFLRVIATYYSGHHRAWRDDMVRRQVHHLVRIEKHLHDLNSTIRKEKAYQKDVFAGVKDYGGLSGLTIGPTAGIGDNVRLSGGQGLSMQLADKIKNMKAFIAALKKLHTMKLPASLFRQIVAMGPDDGLLFANELISGGTAFIKAFAGQEAELTGLEKKLSQGAASTVFQGKWQTGKAFMKDIEHERSHLEKLFKHIGRLLGEEAAKWFHVPRHHRHRKKHHFAAGGLLMEPVFGEGLKSGDDYSFGERGYEMITPVRSPNHRGIRAGGGDVYNITVHGDSDPDAAALRIIQKVRTYKRHHGNQPTGIG